MPACASARAIPVMASPRPPVLARGNASPATIRVLVFAMPAPGWLRSAGKKAAHPLKPFQAQVPCPTAAPFCSFLYRPHAGAGTRLAGPSQWGVGRVFGCPGGRINGLTGAFGRTNPSAERPVRRQAGPSARVLALVGQQASQRHFSKRCAGFAGGGNPAPRTLNRPHRYRPVGDAAQGRADPPTALRGALRSNNGGRADSARRCHFHGLRTVSGAHHGRAYLACIARTPAGRPSRSGPESGRASSARSRGQKDGQTRPLAARQPAQSHARPGPATDSRHRPAGGHTACGCRAHPRRTERKADFFKEIL
ncbi:hypothetical protein D9M68_640270 [compost metagenome]